MSRLIRDDCIGAAMWGRVGASRKPPELELQLYVGAGAFLVSMTDSRGSLNSLSDSSPHARSKVDAAQHADHPMNVSPRWHLCPGGGDGLHTLIAPGERGSWCNNHE